MNPPITSISEAEAYLLRYSPPKMDGTTYTLDRMLALMQHLGDPQNSLQIIHVAGTSGKTSTAYFIRNLLEASGQKTGLTVSPHIVTIAERVQIGGMPLSPQTFVDYLNEFILLVAKRSDIIPTYFELLIAFAYWVFAKEKVDYAVIETGLGGLLDATNVITRNDKVCVLTPIGLDHTNILGTTVSEIAFQKAGIITDRNAVFSAEQLPEVRQVFNEQAINKHAHLVDASLYEVPAHLPSFQAGNWQLAQTVYDYIVQRDDGSPLSQQNIEQASLGTPPGRFETYHVEGKTIILDGAHNPQKLTALVDSLPDEYKHNSAWLISLIEGPDTKIEQCAQLFSTIDAVFITTEFSLAQDTKQRHSKSAAELADALQANGTKVSAVVDSQTALQLLLELPQKHVVITGSLYLVSLLRPLLRKD